MSFPPVFDTLAKKNICPRKVIGNSAFNVLFFVCLFFTARKHRNASAGHRAAGDFWVERTELVFVQLEGK